MFKTKKIVLTGPESVGKSTLTKELAKFYNMPYISEIAREYVENLDRPYTKNDVIEIARLQVETEKKIILQKPEMLFMDTDLIITKIWLIHVYNDYPAWIDKELKNNSAFLYLLCYYDLPWQYDPVRENPESRPYFFDKYLNEIQRLKINYGVVKGENEQRLENALKIVKAYISD